jgi:hypothetical protein
VHGFSGDLGAELEPVYAVTKVLVDRKKRNREPMSEEDVCMASIKLETLWRKVWDRLDSESS